MYRYFKKIDSGNHISVGKSKGLSDESINPSAASDNSLASSLNYIGTKRRVKFEGQDEIKMKSNLLIKGTVNMYIVYETNLWDCGYDFYLILENSLLDAFKLVKNADIDKYEYFGFGIGFDRSRTFSIANEFGRKVINFGVDMTSSAHVDNKRKDMLSWWRIRW